jgi:hypothetical protein
VIGRLLVNGITLCATASATFAQDPIRVETNQVFVPVVVADERESSLKNSAAMDEAALSGHLERLDAVSESEIIHNLTAADFVVLDDGRPQKVDSVSFEKSRYRDLRDDKGHHLEYVGIGGGKWSTGEWQPEVAAVTQFSQYVISYPLPDSPEGSCHKIRIKVNRRHALVSFRGEYCNTHHPASDPLNGSKLGQQLEAELVTPVNKSVEISLLAVPFYSKPAVARVHVAVDWPEKAFSDLSQSNVILGMVFQNGGGLVARFSDLANGYSSSEHTHFHWLFEPFLYWGENRYDAQLDLPPGTYELRVAVGDGKKFGHVVVPFTVESLNQSELAISQVSLCKIISDVSKNAQKLPGTWTANTANSPDAFVPLVSNETEFNPTSDTQFRLGESLYVYFEVYAPLRDGKSAATIQIQIRIVDLKTNKAISDPEPISANPYVTAGSPMVPIGRGIDISKVPKGSYRLEVQASDSNGQRTEWRTVDFTVE